MSHTPGPWKADDTIVMTAHHELRPDYEYEIAECNNPPDDVDGSIGNSNARLIAAAPELLAFAQRLAFGECLNEPGEFPAAGESGKAPCIVCHAKQVVAQATGGER